MSDVMKLAIQVTAVDMLSGIVSRMKQSILGLGEAGKKSQKDFDDMTSHITKGLKAIAVSAYALNKIKPGVQAAADLQEAMIDVKMSLMRSGQAAAALNDELQQVRSTAVNIQAVTPFSAQDVVEIQNELLKAGLDMKDVVGKGGAAWATAALATITKGVPEEIARSMVTIGASFGIQGQEYGELADQLQKHGLSGVAKVPDLREGMKYVAGTAHMMKVSWQDTLTALSVVGEHGLIGSIGGTSLNNFLVRLTGASRITRHVLTEVNSILKSKGKDPLEFWDKQGKLKSMPAIIETLRKSMNTFNDKQKMFILEKIFGEEGARAAAALMQTGLGSWEQVTEKMRTAVDLETKMIERMKGFNAIVMTLKTTAQSTLATLFDPMIQSLTKVLAMLNKIVDKIGKIGEENKPLAAAVSGGAAAVAVGAGAYGLYNLLKGGAAGARVLKGIGGIRGLLSNAAGIATGKAVQAATGVTPVFVTNWPGAFGGALSGPGAGTILDRFGRPIPLPSSLPPTVPGEVAKTGGKLLGAAKFIPHVFAGMAIGEIAAWSVQKGGVLDRMSNKINEVFHVPPHPFRWPEVKSNISLGEVAASSLQKGEMSDRKSNKINEVFYTNPHQYTTPEVKNNILLNVSIDEKGRVYSETKDMNTRVTINTMPRGKF